MTQWERGQLSFYQSQRAASGPCESDRRCNAIFTCFCNCYMFIFPILRECTLVKCHCGIFTELASSAIGQRAKRVLGHRAKLGQCAKFGQRAKSRDASGRKAIKIKKLRNHFKLNSIKAKLKQTTTVAIYRSVIHTRIKAAKNTRYKNPQFVAQHNNNNNTTFIQTR